MQILVLFRCPIGGCEPQQKLPNGSADKELMCMGVRVGLAGGVTKAKVQLKTLRASICFP